VYILPIIVVVICVSVEDRGGGDWEGILRGKSLIKLKIMFYHGFFMGDKVFHNFLSLFPPTHQNFKQQKSVSKFFKTECSI
jgi:hypothetical protein